MTTRIHPSAPTSSERGAFCRVRSAAFAGLAVGAALVAALGTHAAAPSLPTGAQTVAGAQSVSQSGTTLTVTQTSAKAATNWQSFNIGADHTVNFVQPSASAVSLNRVVGTDVAVIEGALNANGHVFLLNPEGVLFTKSAQVNVGGIVASTLNIRTEDFMAGRYTFAGAGSGTIVNQGNITAAKGGFVGLIAAKVTNTGSIVAPEGSVVAGAGNRVTLDLGGPIKIKVEEGILDALIEQGGAIRADGGLVYLTAKALGEVTRTVLNYTGITEARTLAAGKDGKIYLMGGMKKDRIVVAGKLDASAPNGSNGGFVETSAAHVQIAKEALVTTVATNGKPGTWLIDPEDFDIYNGDWAQTSNGIGATTLGNALSLSNVTIQTAEGTGGNGDIFVGASVTKTTGAATTLTLAAHRDILFRNNSGIFGSPGSPLNIVLSARATGLSDGNILLANNSLLSFGGDITMGGGNLQASGYARGRNGYAGVYMIYNTISQL
jgi:filamentous hemagglutinin family protein